MLRKPLAVLCTCGTILALAPGALAQQASLLNPGFETQLSNTAIGLATARFWRELTPGVVARRYTSGAIPDGLLPPPLVRTGIASVGVGVDLNAPFAGIDTDAFNSSTLNFNNPAYANNCGNLNWSAWFAIPADRALKFKRVGFKVEFKRADTSIFEAIEVLPFGPESNGNTGHTNGQWQQVSQTITPADLQWRYNFYNDLPPFDGVGVQWPSEPIMANLVHFVFGEVPSGQSETAYVFFDDVSYSNPPFQAGDPIEIWDDLFTKAVASLGTGIVEPAIPVFLNGTQVGYPCLAGNDNFKVIDFFDEVPNSGFFPLTWSDIVAAGYVRPLVQRADGTSAIGTSVVAGPSFRPAGQPLDLTPNMTRADITAGVTGIGRNLSATPPEAGTPTRTQNFRIQTTGNYGPATLTSVRNYSTDPAVGSTPMTITMTFTATSNITLDSSATGRGFDAFRLITLSSMLSNLGLGNYDAKFIAVEDNSGNVRTLAIDETPRARYLYTAAQPTGVGRSFWLYQDTDALFNPGSPTIQVTLDSLTGAPGTLGVNAFLAASTDPNDDSLSAWLEWTGAPATINAGTVITATFTVRALAPTDVGDVNHDGVKNCADVAALVALCGQTEASPTFNAYADLNNDGTINITDRNALEAITGSCPAVGCAPAPLCNGDADGNNTVNFSDITSVLANFGVTFFPNLNGPGDADHNGVVNFSDITSVLANFGTSC